MKRFLEWIEVSQLDIVEQKAPTRANKGWINIKTGEIIMWSDLQKWHAPKMLSNTSDFRGIDRDELMSILGEETYEELLYGDLDREEVPAYVAYTDSKNWFAFVAGGNLAVVYTENLKQAQECMRWFEKKGWTWKDFFPTTTTYPFEIAMHGGQATKKRGRIQWNREYIKDALVWRNFIKTGRIQDTSKRSEIGNTMAMFRGESIEISQLEESFDSPYPLKNTIKSLSAYKYETQTKAGRLEIDFFAVDIALKNWEVSFNINGKVTVNTQAGEASRIIGTAIHAIGLSLDDMEKNNIKKPQRVVISAMKSEKDTENKRHNIYTRLVQRYAKKFGYQQKSVKITNYYDEIILEPINETFVKTERIPVMRENVD